MDTNIQAIEYWKLDEIGIKLPVYMELSDHSHAAYPDTEANTPLLHVAEFYLRPTQARKLLEELTKALQDYDNQEADCQAYFEAQRAKENS